MEHVLLSTIKSANCLDIGHHGDCLQWVMNIYFSYLFCLLLYLFIFIHYIQKEVLQVSSCDLHSAVVYP